MNRKTRRANKIPSPSKNAPPVKKFAVTYAGANPDVLSRKERAVVLAMTTQVPYVVEGVANNPVPADEAIRSFVTKTFTFT